MDMQVDAGSAIAIGGAVITLYIALAKWALTTKEKEMERQLTDHAKAIAAIDTETESIKTNAHTCEISRIKMEGELRLTQQANQTIYQDVEEIKASMVRRPEWDTRMQALEQVMHEVQKDLRRLLPGSPQFSQSFAPPKKDT